MLLAKRPAKDTHTFGVDAISYVCAKHSTIVLSFSSFFERDNAARGTKLDFSNKEFAENNNYIALN
jgi:hypothetical protein